MRRLLLRTAAGLCLAPLMGLGMASARELVGRPATGPAVVPVVVPAKKAPAAKGEAGCGQHGTRVDFVDTQSEAATLAKAEGKLVFVLHVSGHFEDPRLT
jgi:hypothetical protein